MKKFIGYDGRGAAIYEDDSKQSNSANRSWSPSYNPGSVSLAHKNNETFYANNGQYPGRMYK